MQLPKSVEQIIVYAALGGIGAFLLSGLWSLWLTLLTHTSLILAKTVGNPLDGIRLIGSSSSLVSTGGNHVLTIVLLGLFGICLVGLSQLKGLFRFLWLMGWHEELWTLMLTLVYLQYLNIQWLNPLIFSWAVLFIAAAIFWGKLQWKDLAFVGLSGAYFVLWAIFGHAAISSCISTAPFVTNCANTIFANLWEIGSWGWMILCGFAIWIVPKIFLALPTGPQIEEP